MVEKCYLAKEKGWKSAWDKVWKTLFHLTE